MEPSTLINADYLDIIFNNRNKAYGGYELRRTYNRRLKKSMGMVLLGCVSLLSFSFINARRSPMIFIQPTPPIVIADIHPPVYVAPPLAPAHPVLPPPATHFNTHSFTVPVIVIDKHVPDDKIMPPAVELHNAQSGANNSDGDPVALGGNTNNNSSGTGVIPATNNSDAPRAYVEQMPQFPGDISKYISSHLHYPDGASSAGIQGKVIVQFVVNESGVVSDIKVLRGIGGGCDEEAVRMVAGMPVWKPGRQNGMAVKVLFSLPITFVLNN